MVDVIPFRRQHVFRDYVEVYEYPTATPLTSYLQISSGQSHLVELNATCISRYAQ